MSFLSDKSGKTFVAGHGGMVGTALHRKLTALGFTNIVVRTRAELDLTRQQDVEIFFDSERPSYVIICAAKCGGLHASTAAPAEYLRTNLSIAVNVLAAAPCASCSSWRAPPSARRTRRSRYTSRRSSLAPRFREASGTLLQGSLV